MSFLIKLNKIQIFSQNVSSFYIFSTVTNLLTKYTKSIRKIAFLR